MTLAQRITSIDKPRPKGAEAPAIAPRLAEKSPFTQPEYEAAARAEVIKELRADAEILDRQAAEITHRALSLRLSADHLEQHPPEP